MQNKFSFNFKFESSIFFFTIFFFLFLNLFYSAVSISLGKYHPSFFFLPQDVFADFFKVIINQHNLSDYFKNSNYTYIKNYLYYDSYKPSNSISFPFYNAISGLNSFLFKIINPYFIFFLNILIFLTIFFFQIKIFLINKKSSLIIFTCSIFSYPVLFMINRGHVYSAFLSLVLIQIIINCYLKKNFLQNFFLVLLASCGKATALCFALYIFNYEISLKKKLAIFFLLLFLFPFFFILFNEFNYFFLDNIWSFFNNFENTLKMFKFNNYHNFYILGDEGLRFASSLWGPIKILIISLFDNYNLNIWLLITFIFCSLIFFLFTLLFSLKKITAPLFLYSLVSYYVLASPVTADYHLIVFFGPLLLLLKDYENSDNKDLYIVLILTIAFIVSPQHYYFFIGKYMPEKTILNPLLILCANFYILIKTNYATKKIE
jgi:hypothetical protein